MGLRYTGSDEGTPFVMGVPARDLTDDDLASLAGSRLGKDAEAVADTLIQSGMYAEPPKAKPAKAEPTRKAKE